MDTFFSMLVLFTSFFCGRIMFFSSLIWRVIDYWDSLLSKWLSGLKNFLGCVFSLKKFHFLEEILEFDWGKGGFFNFSAVWLMFRKVYEFQGWGKESRLICNLNFILDYWFTAAVFSETLFSSSMFAILVKLFSKIA